MAYLEEGSGTGSLVGADLVHSDLGLVDNYISSSSESSVNPADSYLDHELKPADIALTAKIPDPDELAFSTQHGHFADHLCDTHLAVEDVANWGPAEELPEMPSVESQKMHEL